MCDALGITPGDVQLGLEERDPNIMFSLWAASERIKREHEAANARAEAIMKTMVNLWRKR